MVALALVEMARGRVAVTGPGVVFRALSVVAASTRSSTVSSAMQFACVALSTRSRPRYVAVAPQLVAVVKTKTNSSLNTCIEPGERGSATLASMITHTSTIRLISKVLIRRSVASG